MRRVAPLLAILLLTSCASTSAPRPSAETPEPTATATPSATAPPTKTPMPTQASPSGRPILGSAPPAWLGTRVLPRRPDGYGEMLPTPPQLVQRRFTLPDRLPELPGNRFAARVTTPAPAEVIARSTWAPGCPVAATDLSWLRLTFWGFDSRRHTGELLVNRAVAADVVGVFHRLYSARFPIEEMRITTKPEQTAPPTGDGNDTGSFNCRATRGATVFSQHAYGLAVDVDPFQNPYHKGAPPTGVVLPELASSYLRRNWVRPGMITPGGAVVRAFAAIGWTWGGSWRSLKDLQHFSRNGQ
jgi:hypothetical protein